ncbi:hypothetical protein E4U43_000290, partial [Claviceps pusilla]
MSGFLAGSERAGPFRPRNRFRGTTFDATRVSEECVRPRESRVMKACPEISDPASDRTLYGSTELSNSPRQGAEAVSFSGKPSSGYVTNLLPLWLEESVRLFRRAAVLGLPRGEPAQERT